MIKEAIAKVVSGADLSQDEAAVVIQWLGM